MNFKFCFADDIWNLITLWMLVETTNSQSFLFGQLYAFDNIFRNFFFCVSRQIWIVHYAFHYILLIFLYFLTEMEKKEDYVKLQMCILHK